MSFQNHPRFARRALALAALAVITSPAVAADDELKELITPESSVSVGIGYVSDDNRRFGMFNGLNDKGVVGIANIDYNRRDNASGTWYRLKGKDLAFPTPSLRLEYERQGAFGGYLSYDRIQRDDPLTITNRTAGFGSTVLTYNAANPAETVGVGTRRDWYGAGFNAFFTPQIDVQVKYKLEEKTGTNLFGARSTGSGSPLFFIAKPLDAQTHQLEALVNYTNDQLQLSGGYFGSMYDNDATSVLVKRTAVATEDYRVSLAPDNEAHQIFLNGGYSFSKATRANFKVSYTRGTQNDPDTIVDRRTSTDGACAAPLCATLPTSLNGRLDTTSLMAGITSRITNDLSVLGQVRYEDREDKTPIYALVAVGNTRSGLNFGYSNKVTNGKLEASYRLPMDFKVIGGVNLEKKDRSVPPTVVSGTNTNAGRSVNWRESNDETTYKVEFRRAMSDTINGALVLSHGSRDGSGYATNGNFVATDPTTAVVDPFHFADRKRDKVRFFLDWAPIELASVQVAYEQSSDKYPDPALPLGAQNGRNSVFSVDLSYNLTDSLQATAWGTVDSNRFSQATKTSSGNWGATLDAASHTLGFGLRGQFSEAISYGADVGWSSHQSDFNQYRLTGTIAAAPLPTINTTQNHAKLFSQYKISKNLAVRADLIHERYRTDDWTWTNLSPTLTYPGNNTVLYLPPAASTTFVGVSVIYRMW